MRREHIYWTVLVILMLMVGLLLGRQLLVPNEAAEAVSFRQWLWKNRSPDLLVQATLIFTGALSIAALLPRKKEEEDE